MDGIINSQTDFSLNNNLPEPFLVVTKNLVSFFIQSIFLVQNIWTFLYQSKESSATPVLNKRYFKWAKKIMWKTQVLPALWSKRNTLFFMQFCLQSIWGLINGLKHKAERPKIIKPYFQCVLKLYGCSDKLQREVGKVTEMELSRQPQSSDTLCLNVFTLLLATEIQETQAKTRKMKIFIISIIDKIITDWFWWFLTVCSTLFFLNE